MASTHTEQPVSRTYQYRKVMKPFLERQRRARINRCLEALRELMVTALQSDGHNVSRLEKADVLELTVQHLSKLKQTSPAEEADRFKSGFTQCATEVSKCLSTIPDVDVQLGTRLMTHLGYCMQKLDAPAPPQPSTCYSPPLSPISLPPETATFDQKSHFSYSPLTPESSVTSEDTQNLPLNLTSKPCLDDYATTTTTTNSSMWRPW